VIYESDNPLNDQRQFAQSRLAVRNDVDDGSGTEKSRSVLAEKHFAEIIVTATNTESTVKGINTWQFSQSPPQA